MAGTGVAKVRKEASFRERKVPFAKGRFCLRKEDIYGKYFNILHIVLILMFVLNGIQANWCFYIITFPLFFPGKIIQVRITKGRFCMKGSYFYSVESFYIKCYLWIILIFQQKSIYSL